MSKRLINLIMIMVLILTIGMVLFFFKETRSELFLIIGIPIALVYSMVCFFSERIKTKISVLCGVIGFATGIWWILLLTNY